MDLIIPDCKDISLFLTEYSRGLLPLHEHKEIEEHISNCTNCRRELVTIEKLTIEMDKIIPTVSKTYERELIYKIFINSSSESIFTKAISVILVATLIAYIVSFTSAKKTEYTSLKELKIRAESMFDEGYYSGQITENEN